ncbi:SDR family NAD(P)-dependent oxidoreductase [Belliella sp. DSM 107340]|uniref:SDR family NAD(P)-dependent oxidoreductase n=1 Tax=Belliella calami TaxID=2923436 RepID=A0ABS9URU3_9BACT|nr:SDR family NAD(P)-dependent oxidoreductase [Belliella calami]MCH7398935.1 SDR family NAD(P)-dependent oxidoreductase [Belliella calami]
MKSLFIITGTSKGIGKALVELLSINSENQIIGISRSEVKSKSSNFKNIPLDLNNFDMVRQSFDEIFTEGDFDRYVLINNAGWIGQIEHFGKLKSKNIRDIFNINTIAPALLMNEFVHKYSDLKNAERMVVNITSGAAKKAIDGWSGYSASKAALNMMTQTAQREAEINKTGIKFYALAPGVVDTEMQSAIRASSEKSFTSLPNFLDLKKNGQLNTAIDVAEKILFLIENHSKFPEVIQDVRDSVFEK